MRLSLAAAVVLAAIPLWAETPSIVASGAGVFAGSEALAIERDVDEIAALEQQALREFRWDVQAAATLSLDFQAEPADGAAAQLLISDDGERFDTLAAETAVAEGRVVALLITQATSDAEGERRFPGAAWSYEITALPVVAVDASTTGPILLPIAIGDDLGCDTPGCGEGAEDGNSPPIAGEPRSDPGEAPAGSAGGGAVASGDQDLARALQQELARVGCYGLGVDGLWGPGSRRAMTQFNAARETSLAVNQPTASALVAVARAPEPVCAE